MKVRYEFEMTGDKVDCVNCPLAVKLVNNNKGELWCKPKNVKLVGEITGKVKSVFYRECPLDIVAETPAEKFKNEIVENLNDYTLVKILGTVETEYPKEFTNRKVKKAVLSIPKSLLEVAKEEQVEPAKQFLNEIDIKLLQYQAEKGE